MAGLSIPLSTLRCTPHNGQLMTRDQDGLLYLSCIGLSPTITCQFVLAHSPIVAGIARENYRRSGAILWTLARSCAISRFSSWHNGNVKRSLLSARPWSRCLYSAAVNAFLSL